MKIQTQHPHADPRKMTESELLNEETQLRNEIYSKLDGIVGTVLFWRATTSQNLKYKKELADTKKLFDRLSKICDELEYRRIP